MLQTLSMSLPPTVARHAVVDIGDLDGLTAEVALPAGSILHADQLTAAPAGARQGPEVTVSVPPAAGARWGCRRRRPARRDHHLRVGNRRFQSAGGHRRGRRRSPGPRPTPWASSPAVRATHPPRPGRGRAAGRPRLPRRRPQPRLGRRRRPDGAEPPRIDRRRTSPGEPVSAAAQHPLGRASPGHAGPGTSPGGPRPGCSRSTTTPASSPDELDSRLAEAGRVDVVLLDGGLASIGRDLIRRSSPAWGRGPGASTTSPATGSTSVRPRWLPRPTTPSRSGGCSTSSGPTAATRRTTAEADPPRTLGRLVAVTGHGGAGTSTIAHGLARRWGAATDGRRGPPGRPVPARRSTRAPRPDRARARRARSRRRPSTTRP